MTIDSMTAQKRLIEAGIGIALLPESSIHEELRLGTLRTIDVSHLQTTVRIHMLYRKNGTPQSLKTFARQFISVSASACGRARCWIVHLTK
jgi:DNA-binding transcriptional LysR family regulator